MQRLAWTSFYREATLTSSRFLSSDDRLVELWLCTWQRVHSMLSMWRLWYLRILLSPFLAWESRFSVLASLPIYLGGATKIWYGNVDWELSVISSIFEENWYLWGPTQFLSLKYLEMYYTKRLYWNQHFHTSDHLDADKYSLVCKCSKCFLIHTHTHACSHRVQVIILFPHIELSSIMYFEWLRNASYYLHYHIGHINIR